MTVLDKLERHIRELDQGLKRDLSYSRYSIEMHDLRELLEQARDHIKTLERTTPKTVWLEESPPTVPAGE